MKPFQELTELEVLEVDYGGSQWVHTPTCPSIFKEDTDIKAVIYLCQLGSDTEFRWGVTKTHKETNFLRALPQWFYIDLYSSLECNL